MHCGGLPQPSPSVLNARESLVNDKFEDGSTALHYAAGSGHVSLTKQLISIRCSVNIQQDDGCTPLHFAAYHGHPAVVNELIEARCNIDHQMEEGFTPLHFASRGSISRPVQGMWQLPSICLQRAVTSISSRMAAKLRFNLLSATGTPKSPR